MGNPALHAQPVEASPGGTHQCCLARTAPSPSSAMSHMKTFIVEDNPVILDSLISTLQDLTQVEIVGTAADEKTAVSWMRLAGGDCELVIIDIYLKSGSGLGVLEALRHMPAGPKRVVLTNHASPETQRRCSELGADRVFDKSSDLDSLISYCSVLAGNTPGTPGG